MIFNSKDNIQYRPGLDSKKIKILVIGDSCRDVFVYGNCKRLAPAAPVPVFIPDFEKENRGMAGNVYENFLSLGIQCDLITNDDEITKTRYIDQSTNHMIMRIDSGEEEIQRINFIEADIDYSQYDAVVISDYNKGFLSEEDIKSISENHDMVVIDTKKLLGDWAKDIKFIKINEQEYERTKHLLTDKEWFDQKLIVTLGSNGCIFDGAHYEVEKVEIKDLTGAGDSFLVGFVCEYVRSGFSGYALQFANKCATKVVQQKGVNTINDI
jgi:bifunctional ADP-heptose synthase (sugar kinase/adenylyltransferase)